MVTTVSGGQGSDGVKPSAPADYRREALSRRSSLFDPAGQPVELPRQVATWINGKPVIMTNIRPPSPVSIGLALHWLNNCANDAGPDDLPPAPGRRAA